MISEPNEHLWRQVQHSGLPVVVLDADPKDPGAYSIVVDNAAGAAEATGHLLESVPASRCYFVGGPGENFDSVQRAEAFLGGLRGAGHKPRRDQTAFGEYSFEWGQRWAQGMITGLSQEPIGALAGNDEIAFGVMRAFQDAGRHIPRDIRIVGFDDTRLASLLRPALSTVRVPMAEIGAAAIAILIDRIENKDGHARSVRIPTTLIIRESSRA
jgi:DNA-binding LacI/PurR family transcriptional regulator